MSKPHIHIGVIGGGVHCSALVASAISTAQQENLDKEITFEMIHGDAYHGSTMIETQDENSTMTPSLFTYEPTLNPAPFTDRKRRRNKTSTLSQRQKRKAVRRRNSTKRKK